MQQPSGNILLTAEDLKRHHPEYAHDRHPQYCATFDMQIIKHQIRNERHFIKQGKWLLAINYRLFIKHEIIARALRGALESDGFRYVFNYNHRPMEAEILYFEDMRIAYYEDTGEKVLPFPVHYTNDDHIELLVKMLPDVQIKEAYTYSLSDRQTMMQKNKPDFIEWLYSTRERWFDLYKDFDWHCICRQFER